LLGPRKGVQCKVGGSHLGRKEGSAMGKAGRTRKSGAGPENRGSKNCGKRQYMDGVRAVTEGERHGSGGNSSSVRKARLGA